MHRFIALYSDSDDVEAFREYYTSKHLPLVRSLPGIRSISYSFDVRVLQGQNTYTCIFEAGFDDQAALDAALESPEGVKATADVVNLTTEPVIFLDYEATT